MTIRLTVRLDFDVDCAMDYAFSTHKFLVRKCDREKFDKALDDKFYIVESAPNTIDTVAKANLAVKKIHHFLDQSKNAFVSMW